MADSTNARASSEEPGPATRALRAVALTAAQAYRNFITHASGCPDCRTEGVDCAEARSLRQIWRDARTAH